MLVGAWGAAAEQDHHAAFAPLALPSLATPLLPAWLPQPTAGAPPGMGMAFPLQHPLDWSHWWEMQGKVTIPATASNYPAHQPRMVNIYFFFKMNLSFLALAARLYRLSHCSPRSS